MTNRETKSPLKLGKNGADIDRDELGRVKPGVVLNPHGRPKGLNAFATEIRAMGNDVIIYKDKHGQEQRTTYRQAMFKKAWMGAVAGNKDDRDFVSRYGWGTPPQTLLVEESLNGDVLDQFMAMQSDERDAIIESARRKSREIIRQAKKIKNRKLPELAESELTE